MATKRKQSERARARTHGNAVRRRKAAAEKTRAELAEAAGQDYYAGTVISTEGGFTPAFATATYGLKPWTQLKAVKHSDKLDEQNPIYRAAVDITASFIHGDGFTVAGKHPDVDELIRESWELNCFDGELFGYIRSAEKYGEQFYPAYGGADGLVQLGVIHPREIRGVEVASRRNPRLAEKVIEQPDQRGGDPIEHEVIRRDRKASEPAKQWIFSALGPEEGGSSGCFYLPLNRMQGAPRGMPSFISGFGYFEQAADALWTGLERLRLHQRFAYDVEVDGTKDEAKQVEDDLALSGPPRPLSLNVHTSKVKWKTMAAELGMTELELVFKITMQMLSNATLIPPHILANPNDINLATASAMGEPFVRAMELKQARWVAFLREFFGFQIWYAKYHGGLLRSVKDDELGFEVQASAIRDRDRAKEIEEMRALSELAVMNRKAKIWTHEESVRIARAHAQHMAVEQDEETPPELLTAPTEPDPLAISGGSIEAAREAARARMEQRRAERAAA